MYQKRSIVMSDTFHDKDNTLSLATVRWQVSETNGLVAYKATRSQYKVPETDVICGIVSAHMWLCMWSKQSVINEPRLQM